MSFYWVLLDFTGFYWVLLGFTEFWWVLLGFTGFSHAKGVRLPGFLVDEHLEEPAGEGVDRDGDGDELARHDAAVQADIAHGGVQQHAGVQLHHHRHVAHRNVHELHERRQPRQQLSQHVPVCRTHIIG